jgi:hypothetical protein
MRRYTGIFIVAAIPVLASIPAFAFGPKTGPDAKDYDCPSFRGFSGNESIISGLK